MTSDRVMDIGLHIGFGALELTDKLPKGLIRFAGIILAIPLCFVGIGLSFPFLFVGIILEMWEEANK